MADTSVETSLDNVTGETVRENTTSRIPSGLCRHDVPTIQEMFKELSIGEIIGVCVCCVISIVTLGLFLEEVFFVIKFFRKQLRIRKVLTILSLYPVMSFCSLTALLIPKSTVITDLVSAVYLSHCLYQFVNLLLDYYGGLDIMLIAMSDYKFRLRSPPCCCCCCCLPTVPTSKKNFNRIRGLVLQAAILRPILMFVAAVLWTNGSYSPGELDPKAAYSYISFLNTTSALFAMYGCIQLLMVCRPTIAKFHIKAKLFLLKAVVLSSGILSLVCSLLVKFGAVPCYPPFSTDARGERLYNTIMVILMCVLAFIARKYYRIKDEGSRIYKLGDGLTRDEDRPLTRIYKPPNEKHPKGVKQPSTAAESI